MMENKKLCGKIGGIIVVFFGVIMLVLGVVNLICGTDLNSAFLNSNGITANAVITKIEPTNKTYNKIRVMRYYVLIRTAENKTVQSSFDSTDFNIYPVPADGYRYPGTGVPFIIKYIPVAEDNFII